MTSLSAPAWAKINLALDVLGLRPDGFHDMRMLMQTISLHDEVTLLLGTGRWYAHGPEELPHDERNLALKAARVFCQASRIDPNGIELSLEKHIPSQAGLGGGSADAAAVLRVLQQFYEAPLSEEKLFELAAQIGSDVPFCLAGGTKLAEGRGEVLTGLPPMPECHIVLCQPGFGSSTPALFRAVDAAEPEYRPDFAYLTAHLHDLSAFAPAMVNVFEPLLAREYPIIHELKAVMLSHGALGAMLTGTGSVVFGLFDHKAQAETCRTALQTLVPWTALASPVDHV